MVGVLIRNMRSFPVPLLPDAAAFRLISLDRKWAAWRAARQPALSLVAFRDLLSGPLGVRRGDTVCIHSSLAGLNVSLGPQEVLDILLDAVGANGTLVFPTFPKSPSDVFLVSGQVFDQRSTPSGMGILTETARQHPDAHRSLHPTKSVAAIGRDARALTVDHAACALAFDRQSPHHRLIELDAKLIGLGVWTYNCSFVHVSDDALRDELAVCPYEPLAHRAPCIDLNGRRLTVLAFAHGRRIARDTATVNGYIKRHVGADAMRDTVIAGRRFFIGRSRALFETMCANARKGITMYPALEAHSNPAEERRRWQALSAALSQAVAA
jgi:aminoglycoside 3-N-acetyltransferase